MKLGNLPNRVQVLNSVIWLKTSQAIEMIRVRRAREVYQDGHFLGIELGNFGPLPAMLDKSPWPPVELPGVKFADPNPARNYHRFVMAYLNG